MVVCVCLHYINVLVLVGKLLYSSKQYWNPNSVFCTKFSISVNIFFFDAAELVIYVKRKFLLLNQGIAIIASAVLNSLCLNLLGASLRGESYHDGFKIPF